MQKIKFLIRNYFGFSQRETNGFLILSFLLILFLIIPPLVDKFYNPSLISQSEDQKLLDSLSALILVKTESKANVERDKYYGRIINPNDAPAEELSNLFGERIARTILKFRNKGGVFKVKSDIKKIYGVNKMIYEQVLPFISLPDTISYTSAIKQTSYSLIDINKADTSQLEMLKGIGPVLASRIIKYRKKLGGYVSKEQFKEVYGLSDMALSELVNKTFISDKFIPKKLNINSASEYDLSSHPYIGKYFAKKIILCRSTKGNYKSEKEVYLLDTNNHKIIKAFPYLLF